MISFVGAFLPRLLNFVLELANFLLQFGKNVFRLSPIESHARSLCRELMCFEQGWISLFQMLAARPSGHVAEGALRGAQSRYPFNREYMYR